MKIFKNASYVVACIAMVFFEELFGKYLQIGAVCPMLTFSFCAAIAMYEDDFDYVVAVAAISGILMDILSTYGFGVYTITFIAAAYAIRFWRDIIFYSKVLFLVISTALATIFVQVVYVIFNLTNIGVGGLMSGIGSVILPMSAYNTILCLIFYAILKIIPKRR